jgi:hypothetical protein
MSGCPVCASYSRTTRRALDAAGRQHVAALDAIRAKEATGRRLPVLRGWEGGDGAPWIAELAEVSA